jgi:hypothetical protein
MKQQSSLTATINRSIIDNGIIVFLLFLFATIPAAIYGHIPAWGIIKYLFFSVFSVFLPGWLIIKTLKISLKDEISHVFCAFALGFSLDILIYAILLFFNIQTYSIYFFGSIAFLSIILWLFFKQKKAFIEALPSNDKKDIWKISTILLFMLILEFFIFQMPHKSALYNGYQNYYQDMPFWHKVCIACSKGYPIPELSILGNEVHWHVFSCLYIALIHFSTGVDFYDLCYNLSYLWEMFMLIGAAYIFFNELLTNKRLIFMGCIILLFVGGFEKQFGCFYLAHLYQCKLGVPEGLSLSLLSFVFFLKTIHQNSFFSKYFLLSILFFAAACGSKIPYTCILLVGVGFLSVFSCKKNNWWILLISLCIFLCVFLLIARVFVFSNAVVADTSNSKLSISTTGTIMAIPKIEELFHFLSNYIGTSSAWGMVTILSLVCSNYVVIGLFFFTQLVAIYKKSFCNLTLWSLALMAWSGIVIYVFVNQSGRSQSYFFFAAFPYAILYALYIIENIEFKLKRSILLITNCLIVICFLFTIYFFPKVLKDSKGLYHYTNITYSKDGNDITRDELIALRWVRDNLPDGAILATNKVLAPNADRSFITSSFTERQIFLEGYGYSIIAYSDISTKRIALLSAYYNGDTKAKLSLTKEGVSHAVLFKAFNTPKKQMGNIIYENEAIAVYELE